MTESSTVQCHECRTFFPRSQLVYYESEGGYFPSGWYCSSCAARLEVEEDQIDSEDIFDLDEDP